MLKGVMPILGHASTSLSWHPSLTGVWRTFSLHTHSVSCIGSRAWSTQPHAAVCSIRPGLASKRMWPTHAGGSLSKSWLALARVCHDVPRIPGDRAFRVGDSAEGLELERSPPGKNGELRSEALPAGSGLAQAKELDPWASLDGPSTSNNVQRSLPMRSHDQPRVQTCDFTTLAACAAELQQEWVPAKVDQVIQADPHTVCLHLRNSKSQGSDSPGAGRGWLYISWHQTHARICIGPAPERGSAAEAFAFGEQLHRELRDKVLCKVSLPREWERLVQFDFGPSLRLEESTHRLYAEVMGNYSNLVLTDTTIRTKAPAAEEPPKKKSKKSKATKEATAAPPAQIIRSTDNSATPLAYSGLEDAPQSGRSNEILACARQVGAQQSRLRQVQVGGTFSYPPSMPKLQPSVSEGKSIWMGNLIAASAEAERKQSNRLHIADVLLRTYAGLSPQTAWQLCWMAGVDGQLLPHELDSAEWDALFAQWQAWLQASLGGTNIRATMDAERRRYSVLGAYSEEEPEGVLAMLDAYYRQPQKEDGSGRQLQKVSTAINRALSRLDSKREMLEKQLKQAGKAEQTQKQADLLMANLYLCEPGAESVTVEDWETGQPIEIPLDPARDPREMMQDLYKRARKQRRTTGSVEPLLQEAQAEQDYLQEVQSQVQMLQLDDREDVRALQDIQEELVDRGYMKPPQDAAMAARGAAKGRRANKKRADTGSSPFRQFTSPSGFQVLIGRNNRQNDELTHRVASGSDLWFHSRGVPGAHTVLRVPSGSKESQEDVQFAADLSAFFSKARAEGKAEVIMTEVSNLKKPKGGNAGQVLVTSERVVVAQPNKSVAALVELAQ